MKKIWMDFNEPDMMNFRITKDDVKYFDLKISERIIFYTEDIQVEAIVFYDEGKDCWFGKIVSEIIDMPKEITEAREDGFLNGVHFGKWSEKNNTIRRMIQLNVPKELILQIVDIDLDELKRIDKNY